MPPKIEAVTEPAALGESPHWNVENQTWYYVDIFGQAIVRYTPSTKKFAKASLAPKAPSFIIPVSGKKDHFLVALSTDLVIISWDGESNKTSIVQTLASLESNDERSFNDGKLDPSGRLWAGAHKVDQDDVDKTAPVGSLFTLQSNKTLKQHLGGIKITNGLAFNEKENLFYYIDSLKRTIDRYNIDFKAGTISNEKVYFSLDKHGITKGIADGMTIDTDGNLWIAIVGGGKVIKIDGHKAETLLQTIDLPAVLPTCPGFGGPNLDELYVTTASAPLFTGIQPQPPVDGATYKITGLGVKGLPPVNFKL